MAASQPMVATWALVTLAIPRPIPAAAAHRTTSGHEKRELVGSNTECGRLLADGPIQGSDELPAPTNAPSMPVIVVSSIQILSRPVISSTRGFFTLRT